MGANWKYLHTEDIFEEIAATNPEFKGMTYESLGDLGLPVASSKKTFKESMYEEVSQASTQRIESVGSVIL